MSDLKYMTIGIDEAGRGALAGPVYAGCVLLPEEFDCGILDDSKKLTPRERELAREAIAAKCTFGIGFATHAEIDSMNILWATMLAMKRALEDFLKKAMKSGIDLRECKIVVDGNRLPDFSDLAGGSEMSASCIVKADASVSAVMAASILAKTERDHYMTRIDLEYPQYGYAKHKGYGTASHAAAIHKYGPSPVQRATFRIPELKR